MEKPESLASIFYIRRTDVTENITDIKVSPNQLAELELLSSLNPARRLRLGNNAAYLRRQVDRPQYICYCKTGKRSSAVAYLLSERGFKAHALRGGLQALPDDK
jgi:rhodanese-related sulfurtransferase